MLRLDRERLKAALSHRSVWFVAIATALLAEANEGVSPSEVAALLSSSRGTALFAAARLASTLPRDDAVALILERLRSPLVPGCEHLFELLNSLQANPSKSVFEALRAGLFNGTEEVAVEAAKLALRFAESGTILPNGLLDDAFAHWCVHEQPYPTGDGFIPRSPRELLLKALLVARAPEVRELLAFAADIRSDVQETGTAALLTRLGPMPEPSSWTAC